METLLSICLGLGLAAACGFRVFVPPLIMCLASRSGHLELASGFDWMASNPALVVFSVATGLEILAYYVPWVDNLLDTISTPSAVIAGVIVAASVLTDTSPMLQWTLGAVGGGSAAAAVQAVTVAGRQVSSLTTAGFGNPFVSTAEAGGAIGLSIIALVVPVLAALLVCVLLIWGGRRLLFRRQRHNELAA